MHDVSVTELSSEAKATTAADASVQRMVCTGCGAEANASCNCGVAYVPKSVRAAEAVKANPERSSRALAKEIGVDKNTVEKARKDPTGDKSPVDKRRGLDGKTRKPPKKSATVKINGRHDVKTDDLAAKALTDDRPTEATEEAVPFEAAQGETETANKSPQQPQTSMTPEQALAAYKAAWLEHCFLLTRTMHWNEALVWMREQVEKQDKEKKAARTSSLEEGDVETPDDTATETAEPTESTIEKIRKAAKAFAEKKATASDGVSREDNATTA
jgi:hypothetical protein